MGTDDHEWVNRLCDVPVRLRSGGPTFRALVEAAAPDLSDEDQARTLIRARLEEQPALAEEWQTYSWDKRTRPSAYLDDCEAGWFDGKRRDVVRHHDRLDACADFIVREARALLPQA